MRSRMTRHARYCPLARRNRSVKTAAGAFEHCVHLRETTPLERDISHKYYAPGIGIVKDDEFELAERLTSAPSQK